MTRYAKSVTEQLKTSGSKVVLKVAKIMSGVGVRYSEALDADQIKPDEVIVGMTIESSAEESSLDRIIVDTAKYIEDRMNGWDGTTNETCIALQFDAGKRVDSFDDASFKSKLCKRSCQKGPGSKAHSSIRGRMERAP